MADEWLQVQKHYDAAKKCFWVPEDHENWHRDDGNGYYHLLTAYHIAGEPSDSAEHLLYARVLAMMADELNFKVDDYKLFHKFIVPSGRHYKLAQDAGEQPSEKELNRINFLLDYYGHEVGCRANTMENMQRSFMMIQGIEKLEQFEFVDSFVIHFESGDDSTAVMTLKDNAGLIANLKFHDVYSIKCDMDPLATWIEDLYCFPEYGQGDRICFDIGSYEIHCQKITVEEVLLPDT